MPLIRRMQHYLQICVTVKTPNDSSFIPSTLNNDVMPQSHMSSETMLGCICQRFVRYGNEPGCPITLQDIDIMMIKQESCKL